VSDTGWKYYTDSTNTVIEVELRDAGRGLTQLGNIVANLPRNDDHTVNIELALRIIRGEFPELGQQACGGFLHHIAKKIMGSSKPIEGLDLEAALKQAQQQFPEIARVWNGSAMSEAALRVVLAPMFRTETAPAAPNERSYQRADDPLNRLYYPNWKSELPSVRRYSSDHIRYDQNGNQYRRY
jgi:hypothetical protein